MLLCHQVSFHWTFQRNYSQKSCFWHPFLTFNLTLTLSTVQPCQPSKNKCLFKQSSNNKTWRPFHAFVPWKVSGSIVSTNRKLDLPANGRPRLGWLSKEGGQGPTLYIRLHSYIIQTLCFFWPQCSNLGGQNFLVASSIGPSPF